MGCGCGVWLSDSVLDVFGFDDVLIGSFGVGWGVVFLLVVGWGFLVGGWFFCAWLFVGWVFWGLFSGFFTGS